MKHGEGIHRLVCTEGNQIADAAELFGTCRYEHCNTAKCKPLFQWCDSFNVSNL